jgi:glycosyltransferase involved in cell wall biosynthesis
MPKVSVIIPVYNTAPYLRRCLDSVVAQTLRDIEIICVNDATTDNAGEILREYVSRDERIKIIEFTENRGVSVARNIGIDIAKGEYIGFVDSDDYIDLSFYETLYRKAVQSSVEVVKGNIQLIDYASGETIISKFYDINDQIRKSKAYFYHSFTTAIYKLGFIHKNNIRFPESIGRFEDPYFSIKVAIYAKHLVIADNVNYYYTKHAQSETSKDTTPINAVEYIDAAKRILEFINTAMISNMHHHIVYDFVLTQILGLLTNDNKIVVVIKKRFGYDWLLSSRTQTLEDLPKTLRWISTAPKRIATTALNILLENKVITTDIMVCYKLFNKFRVQIMREHITKLRKNILSSDFKSYVIV